jgi:hypothetical protein
LAEHYRVTPIYNEDLVQIEEVLKVGRSTRDSGGFQFWELELEVGVYKVVVAPLITWKCAALS